MIFFYFLLFLELGLRLDELAGEVFFIFCDQRQSLSIQASKMGILPFLSRKTKVRPTNNHLKAEIIQKINTTQIQKTPSYPIILFKLKSFPRMMGFIYILSNGGILMKKAYLTNFTIQRPEFEIPQDEMNDWLIAAGQRSLKHQENGIEKEDLIPRIVKRFGVSSSLISHRGFYHKDFSLRDHRDMNIFSMISDKKGADLSVRGEDYLNISNNIFENFYENVNEAPKNLIHVSCTGYVSPSAAQTLVSKKDWGHSTSVTHAYHMGCYASLPALKMAMGYNSIHGKQVDIVNTELCSLHFNPVDYSPEKIIMHTLFADGAIKYSLKDDFENKAFEVIGCNDILISDSLESMSWKISSHNFEMTLAKDVPDKIAKNLEEFIVNLLKESGMDYFGIKDQCIFAIHPGGPKIIDGIKDVLGLREDQIKYSKMVLFKYGNMSSATLPHVWESVLEFEPNGKYVISLAFGPGLTIAGSLMKVVKR